MIKKIIACLLSMTFALSALTACAGDDSSSNAATSSSSTGSTNSSGSTDSEAMGNVEVETSLVIDGETIDTTDLVMLSINGVDVSFDEFRYYWLGVKSNYDYAGVEITADELRDWCEYYLKESYGIIALGEENNIQYTETEGNTFVNDYGAYLMQFKSEDEYKKKLEQMFMTDNCVQQFLRTEIYSNKIYTELFAEGGKYYVSEEDFRAVAETDEYARVIHILIPYCAKTTLTEEDLEAWDELTTQQKMTKLENAYDKLTDEEKEAVKAESKKLADEVLQKAKDGEDFYQLIADYNYDPGMALKDKDDITSIDGYCFTKDYSFVQEFLDGSFALEVDEISDIVESKDYGYHIIKRLPIDKEFLDANIESLLSEYNKTMFNKTYNDYLENNITIEYSEYFEKLTLDSIK